METQTENGTRYVHIYMEANPNPASLKFVANFFLAPEGRDFQYDNLEQAVGHSPLAEMIFGFDFVERVFIMSNFVTVTKKAEYEWDDVSRLLRQTIQDYLAQNKPALTLAAPAPLPEGATVYAEEDSDTVRQIKEVLDEYIRPAVESDGGAINFASFAPATGTVKVELRGSCSGCPSSTVTLKQGIENLLKRMVPEVQLVEAQGM